MASLIALQFPSALGELHTASLFYLGTLLLVIGIAAIVSMVFQIGPFN